jgi:glycosyltransferase involved in cell wall biosynthesis
MDQPLVSVIIPAYNSAKYLGEGIKSVLDQGYEELEVIVIDDGSSDGTRHVCEQFPNIFYRYQKNSGPANARNAGIGVAKGKYIAFLDADDVWTAGKLVKQVNLMERHPGVGLLSGDMRRFYTCEVLAPSMFSKNGFDLEFFGDAFYVADAYRKILLRGNYIPTGTVIVRKDCLDKVGSFDESLRYSEDVDMWLRIAMYYPLAYNKDVWLLRRDHDQNLTENTEAMYLGLIGVIKKQERLFGPEIKRRGINTSACLGNTYYQLAYLLFAQNELDKARKYFARSLMNGFESRALVYLLATFLGDKTIEEVRKLKSRFLVV